MKIKIIPLITLLLSLALSNFVIAEETVKDEHKNNGSRNSVSNADPASNTGSDITVNVNTQSTNPSLYRQNIHQDRRIHKQMEAYKRYLQTKRLNEQALNQQLPIEAQARHSAYLKLMEERRTLMKKMMELQRQAAEERRNAHLNRMNQTSSMSEQKITLKQM